jgi:hypothetical protein
VRDAGRVRKREARLSLGQLHGNSIQTLGTIFCLSMGSPVLGQDGLELAIVVTLHKPDPHSPARPLETHKILARIDSHAKHYNWERLTEFGRKGELEGEHEQWRCSLSSGGAAGAEGEPKSSRR